MTNTFRRLGRAAVEVVLVMVPLIVTGCAAWVLL